MEPAPQNEKLHQILDIINTGKNILLHGPGGVGKTFLLKEIAKSLTRKFYITATTGVASVNLSDDIIKASTLHRFAGVGTANLNTDILLKRMKNSAIQRWNKCDILMIDEVSMLGGSLFEKLDTIAKTLKKSTLPFGGIQLILSGDFLQLPPVKDTWIFQTKEWQQLELKPIILSTPFRYNDTRFFELLQRVRMGKITLNDYKILSSRVKANENMHEVLNEISTKASVGEIIRPTMLYSKKCDVDVFNHRELEKLPGDAVEFQATDNIIRLGDDNIMDHMSTLNDLIPEKILLKIGAQVMLKINLNVEEGLVNGSRGVVNEIIPGEALIVKFLNGKKIRVELYGFEYETKQVRISRMQIPFILAYATSIHRCQGCTLDYVIVDLGPSIFCDSQAYVALSRCRDIKGLFISEFIPESIRANKDALNYVNKLI